MSVICVEKDAQNFATLEKNVEPFQTYVTLHHGGLGQHAHQIAERLILGGCRWVDNGSGNLPLLPVRARWQGYPEEEAAAEA